MVKKTDYHSFLLRLWRVKENHEQDWRASLENVESGEKRGFLRMEDLLAYLQKVINLENESPDEPSHTKSQG